MIAKIRFKEFFITKSERKILISDGFRTEFLYNVYKRKMIELEYALRISNIIARNIDSIFLEIPENDLYKLNLLDTK